MEPRRRLEPTDPVGWALRQHRVEHGLSAREVSLRAGLSESYLGKVEAGRIDPSLHCFGKISQVLHLSPHEVYFLVCQAGLGKALLSHPPDKVDE